MRRLLLITLICSGWISPVCLAQDSTTDPSELPVPANGKAANEKRYRIQVDLDGDGVKDLLLTESRRSFNSAGCLWYIYLKRGDSFHPVGNFYAHPEIISLEPDRDRTHADPLARRYVKIWTYTHADGKAVSLGYYRVGEDKVEPERWIEIYAGEKGTDIGRGIYDATFKKSPIPFELEEARSVPDGKPQWKKAGA